MVGQERSTTCVTGITEDNNTMRCNNRSHRDFTVKEVMGQHVRISNSLTTFAHRWTAGRRGYVIQHPLSSKNFVCILVIKEDRFETRFEDCGLMGFHVSDIAEIIPPRPSLGND